LIGSELGLRINSGEFMWGLEKGKLVQQNLINNLRPISDDAYSLLNIGGE
jgi:hypothetical protein